MKGWPRMKVVPRAPAFLTTAAMIVTTWFAVAACSSAQSGEAPAPAGGPVAMTSDGRPAPSHGLAGGSTPPLALPTYGGGPILQPEMIPVYWGSVSASQVNTMQAYLQGLATHISGSTSPQGLEPTVFQYGVRGARLGTSYTDPGHSPSHNGVAGHAVLADVENEIETLQLQGHIPAYNAERVVMVFTSGITFDDDYCGNPGSDSQCFCARHGSVATNEWFALSPAPLPACLGGYADADGGTVVFDATGVWQGLTSHELFESATDPDLSSGWIDRSPGAGSPEIADPCSVAAPMSFGVLQLLADKTQNSCSVWTPEQLPQVTEVTQPDGLLIAQNDIFGLSSAHNVTHLNGTSQFGFTGPWQSITPGILNTPPVAVAGARGENTLDVFAQGTDNAFWTTQSNDSGGTWSTWSTLGGNFNGQPAAVSASANTIEVFGLGLDGLYYWRQWTTSGWSASWKAVSSTTFNGPPSTIPLSGGRLALLGRQRNGAYYFQIAVGVGFSQTWTAIAPHAIFISEPAVAAAPGANNSGNFDVIGQGADWQYYHIQVINSAPQSLQALSGVFMGPPSVAWQQGGAALDVFGQGLDGFWYHQQQFNGTWQATTTTTTGAGFGNVAVVSPTTGILHVIGDGGDHATWFIQLTSQTFGTWTSLAGPALH
jgi:hypothetical protein